MRRRRNGERGGYCEKDDQHLLPEARHPPSREAWVKGGKPRGGARDQRPSEDLLQREEQVFPPHARRQMGSFRHWVRRIRRRGQSDLRV
jgi:hypothetical protein